MFCSGCGNNIENNESFCSHCGKPVAEDASQNQNNRPTLIGYSPNIGSQKFAQYQKKSIIWSFLFAGILAVITIIAFPIYGNASGEIAWPNSLFYGMGIGGMFIAIAIGQTWRKKLDKTWDGVVIFKDAYRLRERTDNGITNYQNVYEMKIQKDNGGIKKYKWRNVIGTYNYYNVGDRVRHHKGLNYYEKFDKSNDKKILCIACMSYVDIEKDICPRCKCPLLKL
ncbi:MAG: hypothetical protein A2Y17_05135 [Clostridiales bacterium GWF2_38_85]|nr:MAG: hypothetical protein A2Y17_05135 [Clostridiales bacterium GWF2_38_85]HBL84833.1 hypothetical protein [Clostridiales bacterium]